MDTIYFEAKGEQLLEKIGMPKAEFARRMGIQRQNVKALFKSKDFRVIHRAADVMGSATLNYRLEDEMLASLRLSPDGMCVTDWQGKSYPLLEGVGEAELAVWYNDNVLYPGKVRLNKYFYEHYSFVKDLVMIVATVLGRKVRFGGEEI